LFSRFDNKNQHLAECKASHDNDAERIKDWVDSISRNNHDVMSEAITEALRQFEEKVYHRKNVILLLKKLLKQNYGSMEHLQLMLKQFNDEKEEIENLLTPTTSNTSSYVLQRNDEVKNMLMYLDKGAAVLQRNISAKHLTISDFEIGNLLNVGSFSSVHLARNKDNGKLYAIKIMKREFLQDHRMEFQIQRECRVMENTKKFPDIFLRLYLHWCDEQRIFIVMEYVPTGDCLKLMRNFGGKIPPEVAKHIVTNVILAISFLHAHGVVHRDIKPDNLLITPQGNVKLVDFGMSHHHFNRRNSCDNSGIINQSPRGDNSSRSFWLEDMTGQSSNSNTNKTSERSNFELCRSDTDYSIQSFRFDFKGENLMKTLVGNVNYAAPEVLAGEGYDHCIDWWAVGVLYFHFLAGIPPFFGSSESQTKYNVLEHKIKWEALPSDTSPLCRSCIEDLLRKTASNRLGAKGGQEVKNHPHFEGVEFDKVLNSHGPYIPPVVDVVFERSELTQI